MSHGEGRGGSEKWQKSFTYYLNGPYEALLGGGFSKLHAPITLCAPLKFLYYLKILIFWSEVYFRLESMTHQISQSVLNGR